MIKTKRPLRGSRLSSFYPPVPIDGPSLSDLDSAFQLQEYISLLIRQNPHDVNTIVTNPGRVKAQGKGDNKAEQAEKDGKGEIVVDEACWVYEQLRRLAQDLTHPLITFLQQECTRTSCPEMKAGEWLYLCVAHGNDGAMEQCCAIDYVIHTLDSATALLNSPRAFPSRISIPTASVRHFSSLARRLGRIFAHAYFHHRESFEAAEAENALYSRFLALTARFDLVPPEFLVIPPRMINLGSAESDTARDVEAPRLLGAVLNPPPRTFQPTGEDRAVGSWSPEKPSSSVQESPRKVGRSRTDTMVFSDAAAFNEELRANRGSDSPPSASSSGLSDAEKDAAARRGVRMRLLGSESHGEERGQADGIPHVDTLELLAASTESCNVKSCSGEACAVDRQDESETRPYTLTFSASGTMKTVPPPGVSTSNSGTNNVDLTPSINNEFNSDGAQPASGEEPESVLAATLADEIDEPEAESDAVLADLVARKRVLDAAESEADVTDTALSEDWDDTPVDSESNVVSGQSNSSIASSSSGGFVIIGEQGEICTPEFQARPEEQESASASASAPDSRPALQTERAEDATPAEARSEDENEVKNESKLEDVAPSHEAGEEAKEVEKAGDKPASEPEPKNESMTSATDEGGALPSSASGTPAEELESAEDEDQVDVDVDVDVEEEEHMALEGKMRTRERVENMRSIDPNESFEEDLDDVERALRGW